MDRTSKTDNNMTAQRVREGDVLVARTRRKRVSDRI